MTSSSSNPNCPPAVTAALTHCTGWRHWIFSSPCAVPRHGEGISGFLPHFPLNSCVLLEYSPWCFFFFPKLNEEERKFMRRKRIYSYILYFWICSSHKYSTAPQYHILPHLLLLALVSFASLLNNHKLYLSSFFRYWNLISHHFEAESTAVLLLLTYLIAPQLLHLTKDLYMAASILSTQQASFTSWGIAELKSWNRSISCPDSYS